MLGFKKEKKAAPEGGEPRPKKFGLEESCPLCKISEETINRLKEAEAGKGDKSK